MTADLFSHSRCGRTLTCYPLVALEAWRLLSQHAVCFSVLLRGSCRQVCVGAAASVSRRRAGYPGACCRVVHGYGRHCSGARLRAAPRARSRRARVARVAALRLEACPLLEQRVGMCTRPPHASPPSVRLWIVPRARCVSFYVSGSASTSWSREPVHRRVTGGLCGVTGVHAAAWSRSRYVLGVVRCAFRAVAAESPGQEVTRFD